MMPFSVIMYTNDSLPSALRDYCLDTLAASARHGELIIVATKPQDVPEGARLVIVDQQEGAHLDIYVRIRAGIIAAAHRTVFLCEHDVLYHPAHFVQHVVDPPPRGVIAYDTAMQFFDARGYYSTPPGRMALSMAYGDRDDILSSVLQRLAAIRRGERMKWAELGASWQGFRDRIVRTRAEAQGESLDIRHGGNVTGARNGPRYSQSHEYWGDASTLQKVLEI